MERRNKSSKDASTQGILRELDDLQGLLDKDARNGGSDAQISPVSASTVGPFDDIPLLIPESDHDSPVRVKAATPAASPGLRTGHEEGALTEAGARTGSGVRENPFLTHQTREKLAHNRQQLEQDITNSSQQMSSRPLIDTPSLSPTDIASSTGLTDKDIGSLVDQMVAEWLPRIEKDLKKKLRTILSQR